MKFGARRGDASVGRLLGTPRSGGSGPGLLDRTGRSTRRLQFGRAAAPRFRAGSLAAPRSRSSRSGSIAVPRFRRSYATMSPALTAGLAGGGVVSQHDLLSARRAQVGVPRLRLASRRRGTGLLRGLSLRPHRPARRSRPRFRAGSRPAPSRSTGSRQPRFGYGRHSVLAFLVGHRAGGRWLAGTKAGSRANVWLIGRRTGGTR
jgi:hypothetical protein